MQDPDPIPNSNTTASPSDGNSQTPRGSFHRRAFSEVQFRIPDDLDLALDPLDAPSVTSFDELGSEDDLFYTYMDMGGSLGSKPDDIDHKISGDVGTGIDDSAENPSWSGGGSGGGGNKGVKGKHRHSNSVDGSSIVQSIEAKKAMGPDKLAELWNMDPKRAKRIIANRQSAARSKERKARYIMELERKVQNLQAEAATLGAQLALFQRDTSGLTNENADLKLRVQAMEQQAQLRDAVNDALRKEVEMLKVATGERTAAQQPEYPYNMGIHHHHNNHHHLNYGHPPFFPLQQHSPGHVMYSSNPHSIQVPQFHPFQPNNNLANSHQASLPHQMLPQHDPVGRLQGLDISGGGGRSYVVVKSEGPSISASESTSG